MYPFYRALESYLFSLQPLSYFITYTSVLLARLLEALLHVHAIVISLL
jgi:hypothetical protein